MVWELDAQEEGVCKTSRMHAPALAPTPALALALPKVACRMGKKMRHGSCRPQAAGRLADALQELL